jgi:hypothetical protein
VAGERAFHQAERERERSGGFKPEPYRKVLIFCPSSKSLVWLPLIRLGRRFVNERGRSSLLLDGLWFRKHPFAQAKPHRTKL